MYLSKNWLTEIQNFKSQSMTSIFDLSRSLPKYLRVSFLRKIIHSVKMRTSLWICMIFYHSVRRATRFLHSFHISLTILHFWCFQPSYRSKATRSTAKISYAISILWSTEPHIHYCYTSTSSIFTYGIIMYQLYATSVCL